MFFSSALKHPEPFALGRFRGGRATQKVVQTKPQSGRGSIMSSAGGGPAAAVSKPGNCKREVVIGPTTHVIMHSWRPKTGRGLELVTTPVDSKHKNRPSNKMTTCVC